MKLLLVFLFAVVAVFASYDHEDKIHEIETKLTGLIGRGFALNSKLDARTDPVRFQKSKSIIQRIKKIETHDGCEKKNHINCNRFDPQCVNILFVCDGKTDCRNGRDEQFCDLPFKEGDKFRGEVVFDHCTKRSPQFIDLNIRFIKTEIPGVTKVRGSLDIEYDDHGHKGHATLFAKGGYRYSSKTLHLNPPEKDQLGLYCRFDWGDSDKCVGVVKHEASQEVCAKFIFYKKHHDNDDDDDNDNDHHHQDNHHQDEPQHHH